MRSKQRMAILLVMLGLVTLACVRNALLPEMSDEDKIKGTAYTIATQAAQSPVRQPGEAVPTPTPDFPHTLPTLRTEPEQYFAVAGDTYMQIANNHGISMQELIEENDILDENMLSVGQELAIPVAKPAGQAPGFKIIPDSELVYGPTTVDFSTGKFLDGRQGYLSAYSEEVDGNLITGVEIVNRISREYSVNPRLLLGLLEYMSGWVTNPRPAADQVLFPMGHNDDGYKGLYRQLAFTANNLNMGFYLWQADALGQFILLDGTFISANPSINAGTVGVQYFFSKVLGREAWEKAITEKGFVAQYQFLFEYPFNNVFEPLLPRNLHQPLLHLPFEPGVDWSFTGGPHSAWGTGSAWGALDFAPPGDMFGCNTSDDWVTAASSGRIVRSGIGAVVLDLDGDGREQTGWTITYMHIETRDRVERGTVVKSGDPIGHPSCEGGISTGTHLHIARRYNGTWIAADGTIPFIMDGWISSGRGTEYDGELTRKDRNIKAENGRSEDNQIHR